MMKRRNMKMNLETESIKYKRAMKAKNILLIIAYITSLLFIALIISMFVQYRFDLLASSLLANINLYVGIGLPLFSLGTLSGISIGIINLITGTKDEEETTQEFKLVKEEE
jgi:hypothetical protein